MKPIVRYAPLAFAALSLLSLAACADVGVAKRAAKAGDYRTAERNWSRLADLGITEAQIELGTLYVEGAEGVPAQPARGLALLEAAAAKNEPRAILALGEAYEKGGAIPQNTGKAIRLYETAWDAGETRAATALGDLYVDIGHPAQAIEWYEKGFAAGTPKAAFKLGRLYEKKKLGAADPVKALAWYRVAEKNGITEASEPISRLESTVDKSRIDQARTLVERLSP